MRAALTRSPRRDHDYDERQRQRSSSSSGHAEASSHLVTSVAEAPRRERSRDRDSHGKRAPSSRRSRSPRRTRDAAHDGSRYWRRSRSPRAPSASPRTSTKRRRACHPATGQPVPRAALYVKKVVDLDQYRLDFRENKMAHYARLPDAQLTALFGSTIIPIHVPLACGESPVQYEARFVAWLAKRGRSLRELETNADEVLERSFRIHFCNLNATGEVMFVLPESNSIKRDRTDCEDTDPRPTKRTAREDDSVSRAVVSSSTHSGYASTPHETTSGSVASPSTSTNGSGLTKPAQRGCSFVAPPDGAPTSVVAAAYVACGCQQCLVTGVRVLSDKVSSLDVKTCPSCRVVVAPESRPDAQGVADLTQEDDVHSPHNQSARVAAAIVELVKSTATTEELQRVLATTHKERDAVEAEWDDPVEKHLLAEYEKINQVVMTHEKTLGDLAGCISRTSATDSLKITRLQDQRRLLHRDIQQASSKRNEALARVIAHVWRHNKDDLQRRLAGPENKNVLSFQQTSHETCSKLSVAIYAMRQRVGTIQQELDAALMSEGSDNQLAALSKLAEALTKAQSELRQLWLQRRQLFTTLLEYDDQLRRAIQTLRTKFNQ